MIKVVAADRTVRNYFNNDTIELEKGDKVYIDGKLTEGDYELEQNGIVIQINGEEYHIVNTDLFIQNEMNIGGEKYGIEDMPQDHTALIFEEEEGVDSIIDEINEMLELGETAAGEEAPQSQSWGPAEFAEFAERTGDEANVEAKLGGGRLEDAENQRREFETERSLKEYGDDIFRRRDVISENGGLLTPDVVQEGGEEDIEEEVIETLENGGEDAESDNTEDSTQVVNRPQEQETTEDNDGDNPGSSEEESEEQEDINVPSEQEEENGSEEEESENEDESLSENEEENSEENVDEISNDVQEEETDGEAATSEEEDVANGSDDELSDSNGGDDSNTTNTTVNSAPVITSSVIAIGDEDTTIFISHNDLLNTLYDQDNDILEIGNVTTNVGSLERTDDGYELTLPENYNGTVNISYEATDGYSVSNGTSYVNVTAVNDDPVLTLTNQPDDLDYDMILPEDTEGLISFSLSDIDGDNVSFTIQDPEHGSILTQGDMVYYVPDENYNGTDTIQIDYTDGTVKKSNILNVNVTSVNDVPEVEVIDEVLMVEDQVVEILIDVTDDSENFTIEAEANDGIILIQDGSVIYAPNDNYNGSDTITITVTDSEGLITTKEVDVAIGNDNTDFTYSIEHSIETVGVETEVEVENTREIEVQADPIMRTEEETYSEIETQIVQEENDVYSLIYDSEEHSQLDFDTLANIKAEAGVEISHLEINGVDMDDILFAENDEEMEELFNSLPESQAQEIGSNTPTENTTPQESDNSGYFESDVSREMINQLLENSPIIDDI